MKFARLSFVLLIVFSGLMLTLYQNCGGSAGSNQLVVPLALPPVSYTARITSFEVSPATNPTGFAVSGQIRAQNSTDEFIYRIQINSENGDVVPNCSTADLRTVNRLFNFSCDAGSPLVAGQYDLTVRGRHPSETRLKILLSDSIIIQQASPGAPTTPVVVNPPTMLNVTMNGANPNMLTWVAPSPPAGAIMPLKYDTTLVGPLPASTLRVINDVTATSVSVAAFDSMPLAPGQYTWTVRTRVTVDPAQADLSSEAIVGPMVSIPSPSTTGGGTPGGGSGNTVAAPPVSTVGMAVIGGATPTHLFWPFTPRGYGTNLFDSGMTYDVRLTNTSTNVSTSYLVSDPQPNPDSMNLWNIQPGTYSWSIRAIPIGPNARMPSTVTNAPASLNFTIATTSTAPVVSRDSMTYDSTTGVLGWQSVASNANYQVRVDSIAAGTTPTVSTMMSNLVTAPAASIGTFVQSSNSEYEMYVTTRPYGTFTQNSRLSKPFGVSFRSPQSALRRTTSVESATHSGVTLSWSPDGQQDGTCVLVHDPEDESSFAWANNYLCLRGVQGEELYFIKSDGERPPAPPASNPSRRFFCEDMHEGFDSRPEAWSNNRICSTLNLQLSWVTTEVMKEANLARGNRACLPVYEPQDESNTTWDSNYLCFTAPGTSTPAPSNFGLTEFATPEGLMLQWGQLNGCSTYHLEVYSGLTATGTPFLNRPGIGGEAQFATQLPPGNYVWRVRTEAGRICDGQGNTVRTFNTPGAWSETRYVYSGPATPEISCRYGADCGHGFICVRDQTTGPTRCRIETR